MDMAEKIKYHREQLGLTLEELGTRVGVGKSTVRKWETGMIANMRRDKIAKIAAALDVSPGYLMGWDEQTEKETRVQTIARKLSDLSPDQLDNVEQYIDFLISKGGTRV